MTKALREPMTWSVWAFMMSWGMALLIIVALFSAWIYTNQRQQDRDMCAMTSVFLGGPEPVAGPAGDRGRVVRDALIRYRESRDCPSP
jgi:hypothetical protein